jgi:hypothetical protein
LDDDSSVLTAATFHGLSSFPSSLRLRFRIDADLNITRGKMQLGERCFARYVAIRQRMRLVGGLGYFWDNNQFWSFPCCYIAVRFVTMHDLVSSRSKFSVLRNLRMNPARRVVIRRTSVCRARCLRARRFAVRPAGEPH